MNLEETVSNCVQELSDSGQLEEWVKEKVSETLKYTIKDLFGSYGKFHEYIEKQMAESMSLPEQLDLPEYNAMVVEMIRQQMESATRSIAHQQVAERIANILDAPPKEILLSELVESFRKRVAEEGDCSCRYGNEDKIDVEFKQSDGFSSDFYHLNLRKSAGDSEHMHIGIHCPKREQKGDDYHPRGTVYLLRLSGVESEAKLFSGEIYGFEKYLFQLKAFKTVIVLDCNPEVDCELSTAPDYD
ncbi:hypothetical protein GYB59_00660 [bacterium]|nr:hypothetical protein [bacterium]